MAAIALACLSPVSEASNDDCLECHSERKPVTMGDGREVSIYFDEDLFAESVHKDVKCVDCHPGAKPDMPLSLDLDIDVSKPNHPSKLDSVDCEGCHREARFEYFLGAHGQALKKNNHNSPYCVECHGKHGIRPVADPGSATHRVKSPVLCGGCHKLGSPIERRYTVAEDEDGTHFPERIHGRSFFGKGLDVAATCVDCHTGHLTLPHTNPRSPISRKNIATTCATCHTKTQRVHEKIIGKNLWNEKPWAIPACMACHPVHEEKPKMATAEPAVSDESCLECHSKENVHKVEDGKIVPLSIKRETLDKSVHGSIPCVSCHSHVDSSRKRPCEKTGSVECSDCHAKFGEEYYSSAHGRAHLEGDREAPYCSTCHGKHDVKNHMDEQSATYRGAIPALCSRCHKKEAGAGKGRRIAGFAAFTDYSKSAHGKKVIQKHVLASAVCTDCHNSHKILPRTDDNSAIHKNNIPTTCGACHRPEYKDYTKSVHYRDLEKQSGPQMPTCAGCHSAHTITEVSGDRFMQEITVQCGNCHDDLAKTYSSTFHGKSHKLGYMKSAKCSDCHGSHLILPISDPESMLHSSKRLDTCKQCHKNANVNFTEYLTHANHYDRDKYPKLYYTFWAMTLLLVSVFGFFGIHTLLWIPRSIAHIKNGRRLAEAPRADKGKFVNRFPLKHRITHIFVIVSFLLLALTGMMLKFSTSPWAETLATIFGGVAAAGLIHRICAIITFGYFAYHIYALYRMKRDSGMTWVDYIFDKDSMMVNLQDLKDLWASLKWFLWLGPRPDYGKWTYWEKFDYFAVFWGVPVIGLSGLVLWFPEFFTEFLPGWIINVALIIHSDEALLAVGFIFTIHFFNTHLRPDSFPMDPVIFTGQTPLDRYREERPREIERLELTGEHEGIITDKPFPEKWMKYIYFFGGLALTCGILLILLIIYSGVTS